MPGGPLAASRGRRGAPTTPKCRGLGNLQEVMLPGMDYRKRERLTL